MRGEKSKLGDDFFDAASALTSRQTVSDCERLFFEAVLPFGIDIFASGEISLSHPGRTVMCVVHWPSEWRKFYLDEGLVARDPVVKALAWRKTPYTWSDLRADKSMSALGTQVLREIAARGWTEGLVVPIPRSQDRVGLVSLVGKRGPFDREEIRFLSSLSFVFHERVRLLAPECGVAVLPASLTLREVEALRCIALGDDDAQMAARLGVGRSTAHEFIEKAKRKLKTSNRTQAAALAVSMGLISP